MKKTYSKEENNSSEDNSPSKIKTTNQTHDTEGEEPNASCFSSEAELFQQQNQDKKQEGHVQKLTNAFAESFFPPKVPKTPATSGKWRDFKERCIWTCMMLFFFFLILAMGHLYCAILVLAIIICIYSELIDIPRYKDKNNEVKHYYLFAWYIFILCIYYFYIKMNHEKLAELHKYQIIHYLFRYHSFICFMLYIGGFLIFIQSLNKGYYRYQFRQFAYIHLILLIFGFSSALIVSNLFNGIVWFLIPTSLVILNDISAYIWGKIFGKHHLTPISRKKTWEGFIGGLLTTTAWCYVFTEILLKYDFIMCPLKTIDLIPFSIFKLECDISELRRPYDISLDFNFLGKIDFTVKVLHLHTFFFGIFASLLSPLGGLFGSGFKRAIKIKDFAETIQVKGGLTDRMDCQLLMGFFTYVWLSQFVFYDEKKIMGNLFKKIDHMHYEDKLYLFMYLKEVLGK